MIDDYYFAAEMPSAPDPWLIAAAEEKMYKLVRETAVDLHYALVGDIHLELHYADALDCHGHDPILIASGKAIPTVELN